MRDLKTQLFFHQPNKILQKYAKTYTLQLMQMTVDFGDTFNIFHCGVQRC